MLPYYNPELPIKVANDASGKGIGAYICHTYPDKSEKVIAHASRTLTTAEKNYSQNEKEGLALIFAVKKFIGTFMEGNLFYTQITNHY